MERDETIEQYLFDIGVTVIHKAVDGHAGLLVSKGDIRLAFVNPSLCRRNRIAIMAEEYGHLMTSVGDTVRISDRLRISRSEERAIRKAIELTVQPSDIIDAIKDGVRSWPDLSDRLELPESYLRKAVEIWKTTIGPCFCSGTDLLWFDPLELYR